MAFHNGQLDPSVASLSTANYLSGFSSGPITMYVRANSYKKFGRKLLGFRSKNQTPQWMQTLWFIVKTHSQMTSESLQNLGFLGNPETRISSCSWNNLGTFWKFGFSDSSETQNPSHSWMTSEPFGNPVSLISWIPRKLRILNTETNYISILNNPTLDLLFLVIHPRPQSPT